MLFTILSWIGTLLLLIGLWYIGQKKRWAFIFTFFGELLILAYSLQIRAWSIAFIGVTFAGLAARNYVLWGKSEATNDVADLTGSDKGLAFEQ